MQKWSRLNFYAEDYFNLVYRYYAEHGIAYICTYYHLDLTNSICDKTILDNGSYEAIGDLSGLVWEKIMMLPVYNTQDVQINFTADERGFGKFDQMTEMNFPTTYGIIPTARDYVYFEELIVNQTYESGSTPMFRVVNQERSLNSFFDFWKITLNVTHYTKHQLDSQVRESFVFVDYEKKLYPSTNSQDIFTLLERQTTLDNTINPYYRSNFGYYLGV